MADAADDLSTPLGHKSLRRKRRLALPFTGLQALAVVRIFKPRVGMGLEFLDVEARHQSTLEKWLEQLRRDR